MYFQIIFVRGILLDCGSGKPFEMAGNQDFVEPDLSILTTLLDFNEGFNVDYSLISSSVASNVSLGDTNVAVPGRILGRVDAYIEASLFIYFKQTQYRKQRGFQLGHRTAR